MKEKQQHKNRDHYIHMYIYAHVLQHNNKK